MKKAARIRFIRWAVLAANLVFTLFLSSFISEHAICPIGGFEMFFTGLFKTGFTIAGLFSGMVITFLIMSVLSIVFRRVYCGYICPMGAVQEFMQIIGRHVLPKKMRSLHLPAKADKGLSWIKYAVLASFVVFAGVIGGHWMIRADPFIALMLSGVRGGIAATFARMPVSVLFFAAIILASFFIGRVFCRYICPAGAWYALLSKISPSHIVRDEEKCVGCGLCNKACPMNIDVSHSITVKSAECIGCRQCETACPKDALSYKIAGGKVPAVLVPAAAACVFAGSITLADKMLPARGAGQGSGEGQGQGRRDGSGQGRGNGYGAGKESSGAQGAVLNPSSESKDAFLAKIGGCGGNCGECGFCAEILKSLSEKA